MATAKTTQPSTNSKTDSTAGANTEQSTTEAIEQLRDATTQLYSALQALGGASTDEAKVKLKEGKEQAIILGTQAEEKMREQPLITAGVAFAAGYLVSRWIKR